MRNVGEANKQIWSWIIVVNSMLIQFVALEH